MHIRRYWVALLVVMAAGFAVVAMFEPRIRASMPPIPERVVTADGRTVIEGAAIRRGQEVWQSIGGQEVGQIRGHGSYVAPDWGADWLHREAVFVLDAWARREGAGSYERLPPERQAALRERLASSMRTNTYDTRTGDVTIGAERAQAYASNAPITRACSATASTPTRSRAARSSTRRSSGTSPRSSGGRAGAR